LNVASAHQPNARKTYYEANKDVILAANRRRNAERGHLWLRPMKKNPCTDCGKTLAPEAMDFDHVEGTKTKGIADMWSWARDKVLAELAKCVLVCANCHRERTVARLTF